MLYGSIIAVCSENHGELRNALCGQDEFLMLNLLVHQIIATL